MKSRRTWAIVALALLSLVAFGLRIWRLEAKSIWWDESLSLYRARLSLPGILAGDISFPGFSAPDLHPPLYFILLAGLIRLAGESDLVLRFLSVAWAVVLVPLLYATGTRFWNRRVGVLAAVLGVLSPFYLWYAQEARMYTMVAALGLLALYTLDRGIEERRRSWLIASAVATGAVIYTHYLALLLLPVLGLRILLSVRSRRISRRAAVAFIAAVVLLSLPLVGYAVWRLLQGPEVGRQFVPLFSMLTDALHSFHVGLSLDFRTCWPLDLFCLAVFLVGALWPDPRRRQLLLWAYLLIPLLGMYVASLINPLYMGSRYVMMISPAFYLGVARGLERCSRRAWPLALLAGLVLLGSTGLSTRNYFVDPHYGTKEDYRSAAETVQREERPGDVIVIDAPENATAFLHYYRGHLPTVGLPPQALQSNPNRAASDQATADVAARFERIWLVECRTMFSDPQGYVESWLKHNAFLVQQSVFLSYGSDMTVQLYLSKSPEMQTPPPHQHTLRVDFGGVGLEAYDLPLQPVAAGQRAWVTLYWRVRQARTDFKVSLRLVDADGRLWGQTDQIPYPAFPPKYWAPGSIMRHEASLVVPPGVPPGWYRLQLRLYDPDSGRPIEPLQGAAPGALTLGPVRIDATPASETSLRQLRAAGNTLLDSGIRFGEVLTLRAYSLGAASVRPGEWLRANLYWQVDQPPNRELTLTLDLVDRQGQVLVSRSASPVSAACPPALWQGGELLWAQQDLLLPPDAQAGAYRLRLSLRDSGGRQLPVRDRWKVWTWGQETVDLATVQVLEVPRNFARPPMEHALEMQSTVGIDLLGFDGAAKRLSPGQPLDVTLYWRAAAVPRQNYKVTLQLLAADGRTILSQEDTIPANWTRPTTGWSLGEIVSDAHHLTMPAGLDPQEATLIVALYDEDSGRRVQWLSQGQLEDRVVLCQLEIVR